MRFRVTALCALLFCFSATGCGGLLPADGSERDFFVLSDARSETAKVAQEKSTSRLLVRNTKANGFINSHKIIFGENAQTRGYYQLASWVEPPPERFTLLLIQRFEDAASFASVSRLASSTLGDFQLNTEITEFYHDISEKPGTVHIRLSAELVDLTKRVVLDSRTFTVAIPAEKYDAIGAVDAFSKGTTQILDELTTWAQGLCAISGH